MREDQAMDGSAQQAPANLQGRLAEIMALTDRYCDAHLDEEYGRLCRDMAAALVRACGPLAGGRAPGWAAGVVYLVTRVNLLGDPSQPHFASARTMARACGVSMATLMSRAGVIRKALGPRRMDPRWSAEGEPGLSPRVWMVEIGGVLRDIRRAPPDVQDEALRRGLIPFLPEEAQGREAAAEAGL